MSIIFIMVPIALLLAGTALLAFFWAVRDGQYDDVQSHSYRILFDDAPKAKRPQGENPDEPPRENG